MSSIENGPSFRLITSLKFTYGQTGPVPIRNSSGPRTEPCDNPFITHPQPDILPLICSLCFSSRSSSVYPLISSVSLYHEQQLLVRYYLVKCLTKIKIYGITVFITACHPYDFIRKDKRLVWQNLPW